MPTYTYSCTSCNRIIEKRQLFSDARLTTCELCGGTLRKVIHPVGIVFKGSGWYSTDSRKSTSSAVNADGESKGEADGKTPASPGDAPSKPAETKTDSSTPSTPSAPSTPTTPAAKE